MQADQGEIVRLDFDKRNSAPSVEYGYIIPNQLDDVNSHADMDAQVQRLVLHAEIFDP